MPYLTQEFRGFRKKTVDELKRLSKEESRLSGGEFNFIVSTLINEQLKQFGCTYKQVNDIIGALECCKLELYRRVLAPYEDIKIKQNGDVYEPESM